MCGIIVVHGEPMEPAIGLDHRGPDRYIVKTMEKCTMHFYRLAINDLSHTGDQPFIRRDSMLVCNGEIYNHRQLRTGKELSNSDCECIIHLIRSKGIYKTCKQLRGDYAFVWTDGEHVMAARDPFGVRPLFYTRHSPRSISFSSEVKSIISKNNKIHIFPPGHFYDSRQDRFVCYYNNYWMSKPVIGNVYNDLRTTFLRAVNIRLDSTERPVGFLLSGGLDSSLVVACAKILKFPKIKTFAIGEPNSPDILAAREVASHLGTDHTEVIFNFKEGLDNIKNVIRCLETYDTTTIRASTPMWLLCKWIKENTKCRVILSGEGSDEIFGGYKYFSFAPNESEFNAELQRRVHLLHQFDVLRADRCTAGHGLELRVPFLDRDFIDYVLQMEPSLKMTLLEKQVLRDSFKGVLTDKILYRKKDAFSDAVGYGWVGTVRDYMSNKISDEQFDIICKKANGHNVPTTKEEAYYRAKYWSMYGEQNDHLVTEIWRPRWTTVTDPSARRL